MYFKAWEPQINDTVVSCEPETYHPSLATLVLLHGGRFPNLMVIFGYVEICTRVQSVLDQHIVVQEFQFLDAVGVPSGFTMREGTYFVFGILQEIFVYLPTSRPNLRPLRIAISQ